MSSSRRPTAITTARANALQLLMDKARARAGKPAASLTAIAPAAGNPLAPHTPTKRKLVSRAQREGGSSLSSPLADQHDVDQGSVVKIKSELGGLDGSGGDEQQEERSRVSSKRRRLNSDSEDDDRGHHDPPPALAKVKPETGLSSISDNWLAFGDDLADTDVKQEPMSGTAANGGGFSPASSPSISRAPRRLRTKSALEQRALQQREEEMALAAEFDVDEQNIIESPRKSRRGGIRDRIERARNRGELSMDTSERLPANVTVDDADDTDDDDDQRRSSGSDSDDLIIVPKFEHTPSRPSLDTGSDSGDPDEDDSWIVNDDDGNENGLTDAGSRSDSDEAPIAFHNLDNLQWYTLYLEYLARLVLDPNTHRRLQIGIRRPVEEDDPLAAAYRKVKDMIQLRLKSMYSTVWREQLLDTIRSHPMCRRTANPAQDLCEVCNRAERNTCARLTFRGNPYDRNTFRPLPPKSGSDSDGGSDQGEQASSSRHRRRITLSDSDSDPDIKPSSQSNVRKLARSLVSPHYSVGRFCALRVQGYHQLCHAMYHTYLTVHERMSQLAGASVFGSRGGGEWPPASITAEEEEMLLESLLTGSEGARWVKERFDEFNSMLAHADDVLCNRVGALSKNG